MPICPDSIGITLIPRHCGVLLCTPHSSGFRKPYIWAFSISLTEKRFFDSLCRKLHANIIEFDIYRCFEESCPVMGVKVSMTSLHEVSW